MLKIQTTGFEDYLDGSANIKCLVIGGPGAGKTRWSSFWPKPFLIDCEDGRGSIADRKVPYVRVRSSKDMLDALEYLKTLEHTPKAQRQYQTVVVDTADSFQRIVKDEWVQQTQAGSFSGFDAWGYLDTKMQMLFTRLLNLDYNVVALVHFKIKEHKEGDNTVREFVLQMQGATADQVFNDFGLVGWMGTYWEAGKEGEGRVQKRGLTFQPTPDKHFLKDRFHVTPKWMEVTFTSRDYDQLFEAFTTRSDFEDMGSTEVVGDIPDSEAKPAKPVNPPQEGGALPVRPPVTPALKDMLKPALEQVAKELGITVRGNMLKSELITAVEAARAAATGTAPPVAEESTPEETPAADEEPAHVAEAKKWTPPPSRGERKPPPEDPDTPSTPLENVEGGTPNDPWKPPTEEPTLDQATDSVATQLGGEVISEEPADTPSTQEAAPPAEVAKPSAAPQGPSACADCGSSLAEAWADPVARGQVRMSFVKHRRYLCPDCNAKN